MQIKPTRELKFVDGRIPVRDAKAAEVAWTKQMAPYHMRSLGSDEIVLSCFSQHTMMDLADLTGSKEWEIFVPTAWAQHCIVHYEGEDIEIEELQMREIREHGFHASVISDKDLWDKRVTGRLRFWYEDVFRLPAGRGKLPDTMPRHTHAIVDTQWRDDDSEGLIVGLCHGHLVDLIPLIPRTHNRKSGDAEVTGRYIPVPLDL